MAGCPPERVGGGGVSGGGERPLVLGGAAVSTGLFGSMYRKETEALDALPTPHSVLLHLEAAALLLCALYCPSVMALSSPLPPS